MSRSTKLQFILSLAIGWGAFATARNPDPITIGLFALGCAVIMFALAEGIKEHVARTFEADARTKAVDDA